MSWPKKIPFMAAGVGMLFGWLCGGMINVAWFLYAVEVLGYRDSAPQWYITVQGIMRPLILLAGVGVGYLISQRFYCRLNRRQEEEPGG